MSHPRITKKDIKTLVAKNVEDCKLIAQTYIQQWKPVNASWQTIPARFTLGYRLTCRSQLRRALLSSRFTLRFLRLKADPRPRESITRSQPFISSRNHRPP